MELYRKIFKGSFEIIFDLIFSPFSFGRRDGDEGGIRECPHPTLSRRERDCKSMKNRLVKLARILRKNQTPYESKLWCLLRDKRLEGLKFRRQYPIGIYIVDFCCFEKKLIIELDGGHHNQNEQIKNDQKRDQYLINQGYKILRFWNNDLDNNIEGVIEKILISL